MKFSTALATGFFSIFGITTVAAITPAIVDSVLCETGDKPACVRLEAPKLAKAKKEAEEKAARDKRDAEREAQQKETDRLLQVLNQKKAAEEAKFKAEGWWEQQPGIFVRWCTQTCNKSKVIGNNGYSLMEVWAKDVNAGDIYAQVNLLSNGVVVGWTNDTMYLSQGQRGVLTFDSYQSFNEVELTKFRARG